MLFGERGEAGGGGEGFLGFDAELPKLLELADDVSFTGAELTNGGFVGVLGLIKGYTDAV